MAKGLVAGFHIGEVEAGADVGRGGENGVEHRMPVVEYPSRRASEATAENDVSVTIDDRLPLRTSSLLLATMPSEPLEGLR
jgi:hypothetical protein